MKVKSVDGRTNLLKEKPSVTRGFLFCKHIYCIFNLNHHNLKYVKLIGD